MKTKIAATLVAALSVGGAGAALAITDNLPTGSRPTALGATAAGPAAPELLTFPADEAGTVTVEVDGTQVTFVGATPADGWTWELDGDDGHEVEVEFHRGTTTVKIDVEVEDAGVQSRIRRFENDDEVSDTDDQPGGDLDDEADDDSPDDGSPDDDSPDDESPHDDSPDDDGIDDSPNDDGFPDDADDDGPDDDNSGPGNNHDDDGPDDDNSGPGGSDDDDDREDDDHDDDDGGDDDDNSGPGDSDDDDDD